MTQNMVAHGLVAGGRLLGGRSRSDGSYVFPMPAGPEGERFEQVELAAEGTLWSYTVQRFAPKRPYDGPSDDASFQPFGVG